MASGQVSFLDGGFWNEQNRQFATDFLVSHASLSPAGARGLVARWENIEATGGPSDVNPSSGATGIAQWLGSRLRDLKAFTGGGSGTFDQQLAFAAHELNTTEWRAATKLRSAQTPEEAAIGASMFERAEGYDPATGRDAFTGRTYGKGDTPAMGKSDATAGAGAGFTDKASGLIDSFASLFTGEFWLGVGGYLLLALLIVALLWGGSRRMLTA